MRRHTDGSDRDPRTTGSPRPRTLHPTPPCSRTSPRRRRARSNAHRCIRGGTQRRSTTPSPGRRARKHDPALRSIHCRRPGRSVCLGDPREQLPISIPQWNPWAHPRGRCPGMPGWQSNSQAWLSWLLALSDERRSRAPRDAAVAAEHRPNGAGRVVGDVMTDVHPPRAVVALRGADVADGRPGLGEGSGS